MTLADLPGRGITGNGHMLTLERNGDAIARSARHWLDEIL